MRSFIAIMTVAALAGCAGGGSPAKSGQPLLLVVGATGGTGQEVVTQALARGYPVRALVRDEVAARSLFGDRVTYSVGDVREPRTITAAMRGVTYVVSALGSNAARDPENNPERVDFGGVRSLAQAAKAAGVEQFVLTSSMGVTNPEHQLNAILDDLLNWKFKGEEALRESGVPYTIVRPGSLNYEPGGRHGIRVMQGDPQDVVGQIPRADVAAVLVNALGRKEAYRRTFEIVGDPDSSAVDWNVFYSSLQADVR